MKKQSDGTLRLSATDLANHLGCKHLTQVDRDVIEERRTKPIPYDDEMLKRLIERGLAHEAAYIEHLRAHGKSVVDLRDGAPAAADGMSLSSAADRTVAAMRDGADVIVQADLHGPGDADGIVSGWLGRADFLVRIDHADLTPAEATDRGGNLGGNWSYEVIDTKLAQETRAGTILQLCLYTDLLARIQGTRPEAMRMYVVKPGVGNFVKESFRFADYGAYYRRVRDRLVGALGVEAGSEAAAATYPEPVEKCDTCRWWKECDKRRHDDDHLSLVAGLASLHRGELERQGITTLEAFASLDGDGEGAGDADIAALLPEKPERGNAEAYRKAHAQARIQLEGRRAGEPRYELIEPPDMAAGEAGEGSAGAGPDGGATVANAPTVRLGFARLPEPSPGDIFFDIESDQFVEGGGLEYLFGVCYLDDGSGGGAAAGGAETDAGKLRYRTWWATNRAEEKQAFEELIAFFMERWGGAFGDVHLSLLAV